MSLHRWVRRQSQWLAGCGGFAVAAAISMISRPAEAAINVGAEAGVAKRMASDPGNLKFGFAFQLHGEIGVLASLLNVGPYYTHYELGADSSPAAFDNAVFNTIGLRARLVLPIPGSIKPYGYIGAGYAWVSYYGPAGYNLGGRFLEIPVGIGAAYEVLPLLQITLEGAYRQGVAFGGDVYDRGTPQPSSGVTILLGAALNF